MGGVTDMKIPGQIAYEQDCAALPTYHDGRVRQPWGKLSSAVKIGWERNPTPRDHSRIIAARNLYA